MNEDLSFFVCLICIGIGIFIGGMLSLGIDAKHGLEISKDTKINVNKVKYRVIDLEKIQNDNKIILTINNLSGE